MTVLVLALNAICTWSAAAVPAPEGNGSKGSKPGADAEEIDALLAELDAPKQPAAETTGSKKKKKKKVHLTFDCMPPDPAHVHPRGLPCLTAAPGLQSVPRTISFHGQAGRRS